MQRLTSIISTLSILGKNNAAINASIRNVTDHISLLLTHINQLVNMTKDVLVFADGHVSHAENTTKTLEKLLTSTQLLHKTLLISLLLSPVLIMLWLQQNSALVTYESKHLYS